MGDKRMIAIDATQAERDALLSALDHNCACEIGPFNIRLSVCEAHALLPDEQAVSRLIFYRRYAGALWRGEWMQEPDWLGAGPQGRPQRPIGVVEAPPDVLTRAA
jgi:hypothetical protein